MNLLNIKVTGRVLTLSKSTLARNPDLAGENPRATSPVQQVQVLPRPTSRIRQSSAPLMNKLETEWFNVIQHKYPNYPPVRPQAKRYRLGNGIWFKPDFSASSWPNRNPDDTVRGADMETCWEVKGPHAFRGGFENLKVAAGLWPEVRWVLAWKQDGQWMTQEVLP